MNIILKDLCEDREECFLKADDCGGVCLAGDPNRQAEGLEQVVVKVRFAGILKVGDECSIKFSLNK